MLIGEAMALAAEHGWRSVALTFDRHPATVVRPQSAPPLLTEPEEKLALLRATGVDEVVVLEFDDARSNEPAEEFVREMLLGRLGARAVVVGSNFRFGHRQQGDVELLAKLGAQLGFEVRSLDLVADDDEATPVSSSRIRALVADGELEHAARLLGRPHQLWARVEESGAGRAVVPEGMSLPPPGAYRGTVSLRGGEAVPARLELAGREVAAGPLSGLAAGTAVRLA